MTEVHDDLDLPAGGRVSPRLWAGILRTVLEDRRPVAVLVGAGTMIAAIESARPLVNAAMIDEATAHGMSERFWWIAGGWAAMALLFGLGVMLFIRAAGRISAGLAFRLRERAFDRLQELHFGYFDRRPSGWLVSRITADCGKVSGIAPWVILDAFWATTIVAGSAGCMLWLDWRVALWMLLLLPLLVALAVVFQARILRSSRLVRRSNSRITAYLT
jgi:ATP-binding cassette subfamily B protein